MVRIAVACGEREKGKGAKEQTNARQRESLRRTWNSSQRAITKRDKNRFLFSEKKKGGSGRKEASAHIANNEHRKQKCTRTKYHSCFAPRQQSSHIATKAQPVCRQRKNETAQPATYARTHTHTFPALPRLRSTIIPFQHAMLY